MAVVFIVSGCKCRMFGPCFPYVFYNVSRWEEPNPKNENKKITETKKYIYKGENKLKTLKKKQIKIIL